MSNTTAAKKVAYLNSFGIAATFVRASDRQVEDDRFIITNRIDVQLGRGYTHIVVEQKDGALKTYRATSQRHLVTSLKILLAA